MPKFITLQGNIGAGKSTLISGIQRVIRSSAKPLKIVLLQEPVDTWMNIKDKEGTDILSLFYQDQQKYAFSFQMMTYISRLELLNNAVRHSDADIIISERSLSTDRNIFCKMLYEQGKISEIEFQIYNRWFDTFQNEIPPETVVYLRTSPYIAADRIKRRSRKGENIEIGYIKECHDYHENWMEKEVAEGDRRVLVIDGDKELKEGSEEQLRVVENIISFIYD